MIATAFEIYVLRMDLCVASKNILKSAQRIFVALGHAFNDAICGAFRGTRYTTVARVTLRVTPRAVRYV